MEIKVNKKGEGEMIFSWKELWGILKKRKLTFGPLFLDALIVQLIKLSYSYKENKTITKEDGTIIKED